MNQLNHDDYYRRLAASSRALAQRAADPAIAAIHADLAARYDGLAAQSARAAWYDGAAQAA